MKIDIKNNDVLYVEINGWNYYIKRNPSINTF